MITGNKDSRNHAIVFSLFAVPIPRTTPDNIAYNDNDTALSAPTFPMLLYYMYPPKAPLHSLVGGYFNSCPCFEIEIILPWLVGTPSTEQNPARTHHCAGHDDNNNLDYIVWSCNFSLGETEVVVVLNIFTRGFMAIRSTDNG